MAKKNPGLAGLLTAQGFGTRKDCARLIRSGQVALGRPMGDPPPGPMGSEPAGPMRWEGISDPEAVIDAAGLWFRVGNLELPFRESLYLAFHKPADCECSHAPGHHRSVFSFFPEPILRRGLEAVGRLDADTTGLLLLSDSGEFIHHLTSPKRHVAKTYQVDLKHPVKPDQIQKLTAGVELRDDVEPTRPAQVVMDGEKRCRITLTEGRYHQVKRMFGAVGNRVEAIHRIAIGPVPLDGNLAPGAWRFLSEEEVEGLLRPPGNTSAGTEGPA
ncbi:MAG: pseudouridine synthase [Fibrobacteres bacterium]|nr:pseudouridine synthase [Fibrobacterota bacterium]